MVADHFISAIDNLNNVLYIGKYSLKHKDTHKKDKKRIKKLIKAFKDENLKDFIDFDCLEEDIYED